jgi:hypothetical protein
MRDCRSDRAPKGARQGIYAVILRGNRLCANAGMDYMVKPFGAMGFEAPASPSGLEVLPPLSRFFE